MRKIATSESPSINEMMASHHWHHAPRGPGRLIVLDRTNSNVVDRVDTLVRAVLARRSIERAVGRDEDLAEAGLSSLDLVNLMLAVEAEFDLQIPEGDMRPANFRSIARIEMLVVGLTGLRNQAVG
jgi:acyl carrier protein